MNEYFETIDSERLFEASEAVIKALTEVADRLTGRCPRPVDLMGTPDQPACLVPFSRYEVEEATSFLVRMGYLEFRAKTKA